MNELSKVNRPAPLKNVAAFSTLLAKMVDRDPDAPGLAVLSGPSGYGKSKSAVYGANKHRAAYVECGLYTTARSLLSQILVELGEQRPRGSIEDMKSEAIMLLAANPRRPLIIDEAHFIAAKRFVDLVRELSDKSGAAAIMIGEEMLPAHLEQFDRVHNRVLEWLQAMPCDADDFQKLTAHRCPGIEIASDLAAAILEKTKGNTRRIVINLIEIEEQSRIHGTKQFDLVTFGGMGAIKGSPKFTPRKL
ncbi:ATP-binding protein [Mesorhizobium sp.]|uniref:AAA family ATPase n=1 Tax=Mesorhizobium sp. TaxID=1871066 RepID=UPI0025DB15BE|nr:ATP-binding protein [Mesorhizobium sp.]